MKRRKRYTLDEPPPDTHEREVARASDGEFKERHARLLDARLRRQREHVEQALRFKGRATDG